MFHRSKLHAKDNPSWLISNAAETPRISRDRLSFAWGICIAWCIGLPRRAGRRLHAMTDLESRWWNWHVSERHGGLTHQYRDARFAVLPYDPTLRRAMPAEPAAAGVPTRHPRAEERC
jgi:hypothetical protein